MTAVYIRGFRSPVDRDKNRISASFFMTKVTSPDSLEKKVKYEARKNQNRKRRIFLGYYINCAFGVLVDYMDAQKYLSQAP